MCVFKLVSNHQSKTRNNITREYGFSLLRRRAAFPDRMHFTGKHEIVINTIQTFLREIEQVKHRNKMEQHKNIKLCCVM